MWKSLETQILYQKHPHYSTKLVDWNTESESAKRVSKMLMEINVIKFNNFHSKHCFISLKKAHFSGFISFGFCTILHRNSILYSM